MTNQLVDRSRKENIVRDNQPHTKTPSDGAANTGGGLTDHAEKGSMEADRNGILAYSSRQAPSVAPGDFSFQPIEYCAPPESVVEDFARNVWVALSKLLSDDPNDIEIVQGFKDFMDVVISIEIERANREGKDDTSQGSKR